MIAYWQLNAAGRWTYSNAPGIIFPHDLACIAYLWRGTYYLFTDGQKWMFEADAMRYYPA